MRYFDFFVPNYPTLACSMTTPRIDEDPWNDPNEDDPKFRPVPLWVFFAILAGVTIVGMVASFLDCGALVCRFWITHIKEF